MNRPVEIRQGTQIPDRTEEILRELPEWFGIEEAIRGYVEAANHLPTYRAIVGAETVGVCLLRRHNPYAGEIVLLAVERAHHRRGVGRALVETAEAELAADSALYMQVKTLGPSRESPPYAATRLFYEALGYRPLEEIHGLWPENPCLIMVKALASEAAF